MSTTQRENRPGALALAFINGVHADGWKKDFHVRSDAALADLRALVAQRDNYYAQIEQQADRAERAEAILRVFVDRAARMPGGVYETGCTYAEMDEAVSALGGGS